MLGATYPGRVDGMEPGPLRVPSLDAPVSEIKAYLLRLGAKPGAGQNLLTPRAPFWCVFWLVYSTIIHAA